MRGLGVLLMLSPTFAAAQDGADADAVLDALRIGEVAVILETEAVASADELVEGLVPPARIGGWADMIGRINDAARIESGLRDAFAESLDPGEAAPILAFFETALGDRIVGLELSAREVLNNPGVEEAAAQRFREAQEAGAPRAGRVEAFIEANSLIDQNVVGALNANAAFLEGMQSAGGPALGAFMPEGEIRQEVWRQEPEIREGTTSWVTAFVSLAYAPLPEADFDAYIAFSESPEGQALNAALFSAFDAVFAVTSRETGAALAGLLTSEDL